jgi:catechol 2,3-dioxygenase-like lactoylglutathione lyase family enzyme
VAYKLYAVRIFSHHWEESLAFYRDQLGLPVVFADSAMGWAQFDVGSANLGLERSDPSDPEAAALVGRFVGVSLEVDDIDAVYAELTGKGVIFLGEPEAQPWGGVLAHFKDPDQNVLTLLGSSPAT